MLHFGTMRGILPAVAALVFVVTPCGAVEVRSASELSAVSAEPSPEEVFAHPPKSAKTGVWWHWMGGCITREGIAADLDWFRDMGIGSATIFGMADICVPWATEIGNPPFEKTVAFTPKWWSLVKFACDEAEKRGIELGLHNCPGYTSTGGPWIPPRLAMRELVFDVTNAQEQVSLAAHAPFPVQDAQTGEFGMPQISARRTDLEEIAVVDGVRVQHIPMGSFVQPAQNEAFGLECDKMNPEAVEFHLDHIIGEMKRHLGRHVGTTLAFVLLDSYEAGSPTWTPKMREEFKTRRGYDPLPFLPVLGGFKVSAAKGADDEGKFKTDYDRTVKDLYRDVLFRTMHEKLNAAGLEFACEPYKGPFDSRECAVHVDRLMTEFWFSARPGGKVPGPLGWNEWEGPGGRRHNVVEAEAFSAAPANSAWSATPRLLKVSADAQFARGVNRMVLHSCPLQPWGEELKPGKTMGRWGTHFGRNQTWAKSGKGFFDYLARCQALLQWGEPGTEGLRTLRTSPLGSQVLSLCREGPGGRRAFFVASRSEAAVAADVEIPGACGGAEWFDPVTGEISALSVDGGRVTLNLAPYGGGFVVTGGSAGRRPAHEAGAPSTLVSMAGPWRVSFGEREVVMRALEDWTKSEDPLIRHFSGTAKYSTSFSATPGMRCRLDLGDCNGQVARVLLNGRDCGTIWCEPYEAEIPHGLLKAGGNVLEIEFTNVWANRLIGDEQEPRDCEFAKAPLPGGEYLARFPDWLAEVAAGHRTLREARPSKGRECFTDWNYFTKDSPLVPSGLLGPVRLVGFPPAASGGDGCRKGKST